MPSRRLGNVGRTTKEALLQLRGEIQEIVDAFEEIHFKSTFLTRFKHSSFHHKCDKSIYHWTDIFMQFLVIFCWLICFLLSGNLGHNLGYLGEILILVIATLLNIYIVYREDRLCEKEIHDKLNKLLEELREVSYASPWYPYNYLSLNCPVSPSVCMQWTFRDGELVNLPCTLLVQGDLILLRPGHTVPVRCNCAEESDDIPAKYEPGDVVLPKIDVDVESSPKQHPPLQPHLYCVDESVFPTKVRDLLNAGSERPSSVLQNEMYLTKMRIIHPLILPIILLVIIVANICRHFYWPLHNGPLSELILVIPIQAILPLLLIVFPPMFTILNWFGIARLHAVHERSLLSSKPRTAICASVVEMSEPEQIHITFTDVFTKVKSVAFGRSAIPCRTVDVVNALGTATAVCCLDKKGILSGPIPIIEKVFFLKEKDNTREQGISMETQSESALPLASIQEVVDSDEDLPSVTIPFGPEAKVEVLDVSHCPREPYDLMFDDPNWKGHINSLKPLGLAILVNTCNMEIADSNTQFADHVTVAAHGKADTVAVVNRRCLCELSKQIGFTEHVMENFHLEFDICMYKNVDEPSARSRLLTSKSFIRHKTPMPNMISVVVREVNTGSHQLMTQGTADIMLDLCTDYWNGADICPLTEMDRKRILDFYHRQSMAAYCTAFSYCPLVDKLSSKLSEQYIQLPNGGINVCPDLLNSPFVARSWDLESLEGRIRKASDRRFSADSVMDRSNHGIIHDLEGCIGAQCNQIFIGMVSMQYQAMLDVVQLIEQLDDACIRFVHFSRENELRSRVFSEKMGLESGWNCHISLLTESSDESSNGGSAHTDKRLGSQSRRTLSNESSRHCSAYSLANRDHPLTRQTSVEREEELREQLLGHRSNLHRDGDLADDAKERSDSRPMEVRIRTENRPEVLDHVNYIDEGVHCSTSLLSSQSTDSIVFDTQNRAKLPKGIENIRPHLKSVDNVPLLVSLFTDCTTETTLEMVKIMQENGEVVVVIGSTANTNNVDIFLQADASIGIEPLYPNVCTRIPPTLELLEDQYPSPMTLSSRLNNLACSFIFNRQGNVDIRSLIVEARMHSLLVRNCLQFYLCCSLALSLVQVVNCVFLLPPIISTRHVLWLTVIMIPLLSASLVWHTEPDDNLLTMATGKKCPNLRSAILFEFALYALARFLPSVVICILCFGLNLYDLCLDVSASCDHWFGNANHTENGNWAGWYTGQITGLVLAQNFAVCQFMLYVLVISMSFVHRSYLFWQRLPVVNLCWLIIVPSLICLQTVFSVIDVSLTKAPTDAYPYSLSHFPLASWLITAVWLLLLIVISELIKMREISASVRFQKRARLDFGTKLGMNSPF